MKILVFSDSHGNFASMETAFSIHRDAEYVFFLGDGLRDFDCLRNSHPEKIFFSVRGNCDFCAECDPIRAILDIEGYRFFLCHGHTFSVKSDLTRLTYAALEGKADVALFGHTHRPYEKYISETEHSFYLFNPGSISHSDDGHSHYGLIQISRSGILLSHGTV